MKVFSLEKISQIKDRGVFFDANILIYQFFSPVADKKVAAYSKIFKALLRQKNPLFTHFLVISEVVNTVLRIQYKSELVQKKLGPNTTFKQFRDTKNGNKFLLSVYQTVESDILPLFSFVAKDFGKDETLALLQNKVPDINDKAIELICRQNNLVLFTDDKDFKVSGIHLLTAQRVLLAKSSPK